MQKNMPNIPIHDIKPILDISEYSFYYFIVFCLFVLLSVFVLLYFIYRYIKNKKRFDMRKYHSEILKDIDLNDSKKAAYELTFYGATFRNDSPKHQQLYADMLKELQNFKYKKVVEGFDNKTLKSISAYKEVCNV